VSWSCNYQIHHDLTVNIILNHLIKGPGPGPGLGVLLPREGLGFGLGLVEVKATSRMYRLGRGG
jgi:hypothetical protein